LLFEYSSKIGKNGRENGHQGTNLLIPQRGLDNGRKRQDALVKE